MALLLALLALAVPGVSGCDTDLDCTPNPALCRPALAAGTCGTPDLRPAYFSHAVQ